MLGGVFFIFMSTQEKQPRQTTILICDAVQQVGGVSKGAKYDPQTHWMVYPNGTGDQLLPTEIPYAEIQLNGEDPTKIGKILDTNGGSYAPKIDSAMMLYPEKAKIIRFKTNG